MFRCIENRDFSRDWGGKFVGRACLKEMPVGDVSEECQWEMHTKNAEGEKEHENGGMCKWRCV